MLMVDPILQHFPWKAYDMSGYSLEYILIQGPVSIAGCKPTGIFGV